MKNMHLLTLLLFCILFLFGCQDDSDYLVGTYTVTVTTELSSCGAEIFDFSTPYYLPTHYLTGHQRDMIWRISRIGITETGAEKIHLDILSDANDAVLLTLNGTLDYPWLHIETSKPFTSDSCDIQRVIILSGQLGNAQLTGSIRTVLTSVRQSPACTRDLSRSLMCDVTETFIALN